MLLMIQYKNGHEETAHEYLRQKNAKTKQDKKLDCQTKTQCKAEILREDSED